mgnify:FL=1
MADHPKRKWNSNIKVDKAEAWNGYAAVRGATLLQKGLGTEMYLRLQKRTALPAASSRSWWRRSTGKRSNQEFGMEWSLKKGVVN